MIVPIPKVGSELVPSRLHGVNTRIQDGTSDSVDINPHASVLECGIPQAVSEPEQRIFRIILKIFRALPYSLHGSGKIKREASFGFCMAQYNIEKRIRATAVTD
jgi:hypothetical protein